ncbi:YG31B protein, partial [Pseudoatta argentina]
MLHLGIRRITWNFCVASVPYPIIEADLIAHYNLLPDLKGRRLIDSQNNVYVSGIVKSVPQLAISTVKPSTKFANILYEFLEVTGLEQATPNCSSDVRHHIIITGPPVAERPRRLISFMVQKKDGSWRICGDYCRLNAITVPDQFPVPHLHDCFSNLRGKVIFSKLDLYQCEFGKQELEFLGFTINSEGCKSTLDKVQAIREFPRPNTIELRRFLGLVNFYRKLLHNAAIVQAPLNEYLRNSRKNDKRPIIWTPVAEEAFNKCKESLANVTILSHSSDAAETRRVCDASDFAIGAALEQRLDDSLHSNKKDKELRSIRESPEFPLIMKRIQWGPMHTTLYCEMIGEAIRPYIPASLRDRVFHLFHDAAHSGTKVTNRIIRQRYVWPNVHRDIAKWCKNCHDYIEAITVARVFYNNWVANFGAPKTITTDQGSQFEAQLFTALLQLIGCQRIRTTAYHLASNGMIERWHRSLKAAIMCHANEGWSRVLSTVLLGLRTHVRLDTGASPAKFVYGTTLRVSGEFVLPDDFTSSPQIFIEEFREHMRKVKPISIEHEHKKRVFARI